MVTLKRPGKVTLTSDRKMAAGGYGAIMEEITLERQVEFVFPEGIRDLKTAYNRRLSPGKYKAEVSLKHGNRMLISQSHTFCVE